MERYERSKSEEAEDQDSYIRDVAAVWGHLDLIEPWLPLHRDDRAKVTDYVLFPSAMYGQLEVLKLALRYGDLQRKGDSKEHPGWSLMHFAVEGAQRNLPIASNDKAANECEISLNNEANIPRTVIPKSSQEILDTQLDIIYTLYEAGADPAATDDYGYSPSYRACKQLESIFLQGAFLLDILTLLKVDLSQDAPPDTPPDTPGLSFIPGVPGWKEAIQCLVEWAYSRGHFEVLKFCQERKYVSLSAPTLLIKSNRNTLRQCENPLIIDAVHKGNYPMIESIMGISNTPSNVLCKVYDYSHGHRQQEKESIMAYACHLYLERKPQVLSNILSLRCDPKFLTRITLSGAGLRQLPYPILHPNLMVLDVRENLLDGYPTDGKEPYRLGWHCPSLQTLNFSNNLFTMIHPDIFLLPNLSKLLMSGNRITEVPMDMWTAPLLKHLELNGNMIHELPCPNSIPRSSQSVFASILGTVRADTGLESFRRGYISHDACSPKDLHRSQIGFALTFLDLSENRLSSIPRGLPCLAPLLQTLKLANNAITNLGDFSIYPSLLQTLDVTSNGLTVGIEPPTHDMQDECYQTQLVEGHTHCSHYDHKNLSSLKFLYLCNNRIEDLQIEQQGPDVDLEVSQTVSEEDVPIERDPPGLYFPKLQTLKISNNSLGRFPKNIHRLTKLRELVVSGNERIVDFPPGLHKLTSLFTFQCSGIRSAIVQELAHFKSVAEMLYYLKARELRSVPNTCMRLFMIGHYSKGKTTLLNFLTGASSGNQEPRRRRAESETSALPADGNSSTVGIQCGRWVCTPNLGRRSVSSPTAITPINFYTWDFAGQEEYYVTHQCFLTNRALYLLVWNVLDGDAGIQCLSVWLQNLQARAEGCSHTVIVVGTHLDQVPLRDRDRKCTIWRDQLEKYRIGCQGRRYYPTIVQVHFVGCPPGRGSKGINIESLNNLIHTVASSMESPRSLDDAYYHSNFKLKVLEEKIPASYEQLRIFIESLRRRSDTSSFPAMHKRNFYDMVSDIIVEGESELETAIDYLHATTGVVLHFNIPVMKDYYIIDPQRWFDLCALVISPNNVSSLVRFGRPGDERFGLLQSSKMKDEFTQRGCSEDISKLVRTFLSQLGIIHQVNNEYCLIPSAIDPDPYLRQKEILGTFPRHQVYQYGRSMDSMEQVPSHVGPLVSDYSAGGILGMKRTGLVYRRMLFLPPIASGFWSKLIALCLQKQDFQQIVLLGIPFEYREWSLQPCGPAHRLRSMIGNLDLSWMYWKAGIILYVNEMPVLELYSLRSHEFEDPVTRSEKAEAIFESRTKKAKHFVYEGSNGWRFLPPHFHEVIEIVVPEMVVTIKDVSLNHVPPMSSKILVKALEIVDEVLKNHCEQFALTGIYSVGEMMHVIPCPIEYGDNDERHHEFTNTHCGNLSNSIGMSLSYEEAPPPPEQVDLPHDCICVFPVDACIRQTFTSDFMTCPKCGRLELESLAPDLVFTDIAEFKRDKEQLNLPVSKESEPVAKGAFGIVFRRTLHTPTDGDVDVAVKLFDQMDSLLPLTQAELTRSYSDMRYELNKLCSLHNSHIVQFVGIITNPHCFLLEWAPLMSLENRRAEYEHANASMCFTTILYVLLQVSSALSYLHSPQEVGIVHRDLKSSNILVFRFPKMGHKCFSPEGKQEDCRVLVKITDMGISANPLATKARPEGGLRILVPECIVADNFTLTEKVDIFSLGSCLYEMMSLRALPPLDIGEPHYKQILLSGKRPQFHAKDVCYPPLLFQVLEDCWQQEHYHRPSAEGIYRSLQALTDLSIAENRPTTSEIHNVLLDSFTLHEEHRISAVHCYESARGFEACVAISGQDGSTAIVNVVYDHQSDKSELLCSRIASIKNTEVVSLQVTPGSEIILACSDGTVSYYDTRRQATCLNQDTRCRDAHGSITKAHYCHESKLLVIAFENGMVHIRKCTLGVTSHLAWRECCLSLVDNTKEIFDMQCSLLTSGELQCPVFEVWLGIDSGHIEVWKMPVSPTEVWAYDTVSRIRTVSKVVLSEVAGGSVRQVWKSQDGTMMVGVVYTERSKEVEIAIVSVESKLCLTKFDFKESISSLLLTPSILAFGTFEGEIYIHHTPAILSSPERTAPTILHGHFNRVYALYSQQGHINTDGSSALFPAYLGLATEEVRRDYLISIGFGRGYSCLKKNKMFRKSSAKRGSFINAWML